MFKLFGIYQKEGKAINIAQHRIARNEIRTRFPRQTSYFQDIARDELILSGTDIKQYKIGDNELFFSGEIYNEEELLKYLPSQTPSTTNLAELTLKLIIKDGLDALIKFNGAFNIIWINTKKKSFKLINDQLSIRQLFYFNHHDFILFSTELKFLFAHPQCPKEIDWHSALKRPIPFLILNHNPDQNAWFKNIYKMKGAEVIHCENTRDLQHHIYWDPFTNSEHNSQCYDSCQEYEDAYMSILEDAVRIRCKERDEVCTMLSGGLDSSIITAIAADQKPLHSYSIVTQATFQEKSTHLCQQLAKDFSLQHRQVVYSFDDLMADFNLWQKRVWHSESPVVHKDAIGKTLLHAAIEQVDPHLRHVLTGTGSDQLNGGLVRWLNQDKSGDENKDWEQIINVLREEDIKRFISQNDTALWSSNDLLSEEFIMSHDQSQPKIHPWHQYLRSCLAGNQFALIWDENRAAYSQNHNVRYPFMDHRFLPLVLNAPQELHQQLFFDKRILRNPSSRYLNTLITDQPKSPGHGRKKDLRIQWYTSFIQHHKSFILNDLFESSGISQIIDNEKVARQIDNLLIQPDIISWEYVMNIINLAILALLPDQTESTIEYESELLKHVDIITSTNENTNNKIQNFLNIPSEADLLNKPLSLAPNCTISRDLLNKTDYIVIDGTQEYELDNAYPHWKTFLTSLDGKRSALEICESFNLDLASFRGFLDLCFEEEIILYPS